MKENRKQIKLENNIYEIIENKNDCLDISELIEKYTDYFYPFDYILGDYAYNKLRLKGFCDKNNKRYNRINDISLKEKYLKNQCAYHCNFFLIKKVKDGVN